MEVFFVKYRVLVIVLSVITLIYFPVELYNAIEYFSTNKIGAGVGTLINSAITLFVAVYLIINVRRANKKT